MNKIIWLVALALFPVLLRGGVGSYASIDEKMTEAFNSQPKRAVDAYIYAMQLVERSNLDSGKKARKWREKGQAVFRSHPCQGGGERPAERHRKVSDSDPSDRFPEPAGILPHP